jgi:FdhD protein
MYPGNDEDLALGFIFTEGIITRNTDIKRIEHVITDCTENKQNIIQITLGKDIIPNLLQAERNFYTTSSCGVCGKSSIIAIRTVSSHPSESGMASGFIPACFSACLINLRHYNNSLRILAGLHAAALFSREGELKLIRRTSVVIMRWTN